MNLTVLNYNNNKKINQSFFFVQFHFLNERRNQKKMVDKHLFSLNWFSRYSVNTQIMTLKHAFFTFVFLLHFNNYYDYYELINRSKSIRMNTINFLCLNH